MCGAGGFLKNKIMEVILEKYEHIVMGCAIQQTDEFSISDLHGTLYSVGKTKLGKASLQMLLDQLVKKKLIKKDARRCTSLCIINSAKSI